MQPASNARSVSVWLATADLPRFPPLAGDVDAEVCVIGAGIAGLTTAYLLAREGKQVLLFDAIGIGAGETGRTTAHFFPPDEWYVGVEKAVGRDGARLIAESFAAATNLVENIIEREGIDCEFERLDGYLFALPGNGFQDLDKELAAARRAGVDTERLDRVPGLSFDTGPCIRYRNQGQFHPLKYLAGLTRAFMRDGGRIHCGTYARSLSGNDAMQVVETDHGRIRAKAVVIATNTPFNDRVVMHTKQVGYHTYVIGVRVPRGAVPRILLWDTGDPYYYIRLETPDSSSPDEILVVGGADHKVGDDPNPAHRYDEIERWVRERYPMAGEVAYRWSGEVMEPSDGPAYLGRNPADDKNVYIITGDSGNGMTHTTIGAMIVTDQIMGRENRWASVYDPSRKVKHGIGEFLMEQADTLSKYREWVTGGEVDTVQEIAAGQGAILRQGMHKVAVYRDDQGALHAVSATCTHMGCIVHWNGSERSWDCPCHGSRFDTQGEVLHGPAPTPLQTVSLEQQAPPSSAPHVSGPGRPGQRP